MRQTIGHHTDEQVSVVERASFTTKAGKVLLAAQAKLRLHILELRFPVDLFHMVGCYRQQMTTTLAARRQYFTTIPGLHTLTEAMYTLTTANFRLPSTLGCHALYTSLRLNKGANKHASIGLTEPNEG
jgi:hypothetical protein